MAESKTDAQAARETFVSIVSDAVNEYNTTGAQSFEIAEQLVNCISAIIEKSTKPNLSRILICYTLSKKFDAHMHDLLEQCIKE